MVQIFLQMLTDVELCNISVVKLMVTHSYVL